MPGSLKTNLKKTTRNVSVSQNRTHGPPPPLHPPKDPSSPVADMASQCWSTFLPRNGILVTTRGASERAGGKGWWTCSGLLGRKDLQTFQPQPSSRPRLPGHTSYSHTSTWARTPTFSSISNKTAPIQGIGEDNVAGKCLGLPPGAL